MVMMKAVLSPLSTHADIVNPSPAMTDEGMSIYYNTASFYAQEIPDSDPNDETCEPIKHKKLPLKPLLKVILRVSLQSTEDLLKEK